jgi:hypothetical protein
MHLKFRNASTDDQSDYQSTTKTMVPERSASGRWKGSDRVRSSAGERVKTWLMTGIEGVGYLPPSTYLNTKIRWKSDEGSWDLRTRRLGKKHRWTDLDFAGKSPTRSPCGIRPWHRLKRTGLYNSVEVIDSAWENGTPLSPRETTYRSSLCRHRVPFAKKMTHRQGTKTHCTCPYSPPHCSLLLLLIKSNTANEGGRWLLRQYLLHEYHLGSPMR